MGRSFGRTIVWVAGLVTAVACGGPTELSPITEVVVESGDQQTGVAGQPLAQPIVVRVIREDGSAAVWVKYVQLVSDGELELGGARGGGPGVTITAPSDDQTSIVWTLGSEVGEQRLRIFAVPSRGDTIEAFATATAQAPPR